MDPQYKEKKYEMGVDGSYCIDMNDKQTQTYWNTHEYKRNKGLVEEFYDWDDQDDDATYSERPAHQPLPEVDGGIGKTTHTHRPSSGLKEVFHLCSNP